MEPTVSITQAAATGPADIGALLDRLQRAHARLRERRVDDILVSLEGLAALWLRPDSAWRRAAEQALPAATGFSPEMIRFGLPWMIEPLRAPAIADLLAAELGDRDVLDGFVTGRRASGPAIVLHVLAGNLPAAAAIPIALSLAVKSCPLVKPGSGDQVFPDLFAQSIAAVDADLAECVGVCYWRGGDRAGEERAFAGAELVVASGSDATIADLGSRCPVRLIGQGHKVSFAVVTADVVRNPAAARTAAESLAIDVTLWDQRGCLSPQICLVEGTFEAACGFAALLAPELARLAERLPPGPRTLADHVAVRRFRDEEEWKRVAGQPVALFASADSTDWTIVVEGDSPFRPTPLGRSIRVRPLSSVAALPGVLGPARTLLEAAGRMAASEQAAELDEVLARAGVHWIAPLGRMQCPPLSWSQGGRPRIGDWIRWTGTASADERA